jgi:cytidyltransferase-like protein
MKIAITSGYFNPIHPGHIECFKLAKELPEITKLCVIVNNDKQAFLKRGVQSFQKQEDRISIVSSIKCVDDVFLSIDDDLTVCNTLKNVVSYYQAMDHRVGFVFAKGGDRFSNNTPEKIICDELGIQLIDGLGAKTHNSSDYVKGIV